MRDEKSIDEIKMSQQEFWNIWPLNRQQKLKPHDTTSCYE